MKIENPFTKAQGRAQHICWKHLKNLGQYHIELILPFACLIQEYGREGGYLVFAATVIEDGELHVLKMFKDENIVIDLPVRVFTRAWGALPWKFREQFTEKNNLKLQFTKQSQKDLRFNQVDITTPLKDQTEFSKTIYNHPENYVNKNFIHNGNTTKITKK